MKVVQLNKAYWPHVGGIETCVKIVAEALFKHGIVSEVLVCAVKNKSKIEALEGVKVLRSASLGNLLSMPISWKYFVDAKKNLRSADVVVVHHPFPLGVLVALLFAYSKPIVVWYHADLYRQKISKYFYYIFLYLLLKKAKLILVSNEDIKARSRVLSFSRGQIKVLPFGVNVEAGGHMQDRFKVIESVLVNKKWPIVLAVGRLVYYKGFEYLIEAVRDLDVNLLIIGEGPLRSNLEKKIQQLGLKDKVYLLGFRANLSEYFDIAKLFVLPAIEVAEAFGIVQIEAMAHALPVINTDLPGVREVGQHKITGLTVKPKDSQALKMAIMELLGDEQVRVLMGRAGKKQVVEKYSLIKFEEKAVQLIMSVI